MCQFDRRREPDAPPTIRWRRRFGRSGRLGRSVFPPDGGVTRQGGEPPRATEPRNRHSVRDRHSALDTAGIRRW